MTAGVLGGCHKQGGVTLPPMHAVTWSSHFDPENTIRTQEDIRVMMDTPWEDTLLVTPEKGDVSGPIELSSCSDYLAVRDRSVRSEATSLGIFQSRAMACIAADLLLKARPPGVDNLGALVFDSALPERLPVGVASISSAMEYERALADPTMRTWSDYAGPIVFEALDALSGTYREQDSGQSMNIALLGRGDFNGDGVADVLLASNEWAAGGSWRASRLFLITQRTESGAIELLETLDAW